MMDLNGEMRSTHSWSAKVFRQAGEIPSGSGAFLVFCFLKNEHTSSSPIRSPGQERGFAGDVDGCAESASECVFWV